jgi:hypothetical protein
MVRVSCHTPAKRHEPFPLPCLVYLCVGCNAGLEYSGGYPRSALRDECLPILDSRTVQLVTIFFLYSFSSRVPRADRARTTMRFNHLNLYHLSLTRVVPVMGMLCGNAIMGISVSLAYILRELE